MTTGKMTRAMMTRGVVPVIEKAWRSGRGRGIWSASVGGLYQRARPHTRGVWIAVDISFPNLCAFVTPIACSFMGGVRRTARARKG